MASSWRLRGICWFALLWLFASPPAVAAARRAVLIGIDDYSASRIPPRTTARPGPSRSLRNLEGTVNDIREVRRTLLDQYGFAEPDIVTLLDQDATRDAILRTIERHLVQPSRPGDILLLYFAGHGSQVLNSLSDEPDHLDESIVPADSRRGAEDIRDKELRRLFNQILDRKALLTVVLDSCHSGSGARVPFTGALSRGVLRDNRDIRDGSAHGPRPEDRGALVLSAAQDFDLAWETQGPDGLPHGAFSLALVHAMRSPLPGETAEETFLRARARLQAEKRFQEPVLAGAAAARRSPFLGGRTERTAERTAVAVERVEPDGTVILQGGWANGLTPGSELRLLDTGARLAITEVTDLSRCKARLVQPVRLPKAVSPQKGMLAEVVAWAAPPGAPLRVSIPEASSLEPALALAEQLAREAPRRGVQWIDDPTEKTPTYILRWHNQGWELLDTAGEVERFAPDAPAGSVLAKLSARPAGLFVQLPAPAALARSLVLGPGTPHSAVEPTGQPQDSEYILAGRLSAGRPEYAWLRSDAIPEDRRRSGLPLRSTWQSLGARDSGGRFPESGPALENAILKLGKIHAWQRQGSPAGGAWVYELALRKESTGTLIANGTLPGKEPFSLLLRAKNPPLPAAVETRYVYIFVIDSYGRSTLLYPPRGSVENRFPQPQGPGQLPQRPPAEISLGRAIFQANAPYGVDTYLLLTTDEPIPSPWVLEWDGIRTRAPGATPLEELLARTSSPTRAVETVLVPATWSLERTLIESVPPDAASRPAG